MVGSVESVESVELVELVGSVKSELSLKSLELNFKRSGNPPIAINFSHVRTLSILVDQCYFI